MTGTGLSSSILLSAFLLDLAIGDPRWLPHPVRIIGSFINRVEALLRGLFRTGSSEKFAGIVLVLLIVIPTFFLTLFLIRAADGISGFVGILLMIYLASTTIAVRGLTDAAKAVINAVNGLHPENARAELGMIVGRDTQDLSDRDVLKATMETLAENLSDGIIAPIFYMAIGGIPLAMTYKAINTLDSMVGYKNERYRNFGWAAARLDDMANYIPARITGGLIALAALLVSGSLENAASSWKTMIRDGRNHTSPNSGIPEAAMAGALGIRMGGPATYGGMVVDKPYIGKDRTGDYMAASEAAMRIVMISSVLGIIIAAIILFIRNMV